MLIILLIILCVFLLLLRRLGYQDLRRLPPGPRALPGLLGNICQLFAYRNDPPYLICHELNQRYGPMMSIRIGVLSQVITSDVEFMRKILTSEDFEDRFYNDYVGLRSYGKPLGILLGTGGSWREMRRFVIKTLREFGYGKPEVMTPIIHEETHELLRFISRKTAEDTEVDMKHFFTPAVINLLWNLMVGYRFCHDDPKLHKLIYLTDELVRINPAFVNISMALPFLSPITSWIVPHVRRMVQCTEAIRSFFQELLNERRDLGIFTEHRENFVDAFLFEMELSKDRHKFAQKYYTDEQFVIVMLDLFMAGSETTTSMLEWAVHFMTLHPQVQTNVQLEIDQIVGRKRLPNYQDRARMPYTQATLLEIQRLANVNPQNVRSPIRDTKIGNFDIPKGSFTVLNTYSYNLDPQHWPQPLKFIPERFLSPDGQQINTNRLLTFGLGRRACVGESLAKASVFTLLTALLQSYSIKPSPHSPLSCEPLSGTTLAPQPFSVLLQSRNSDSP